MGVGLKKPFRHTVTNAVTKLSENPEEVFSIILSFPSTNTEDVQVGDATVEATDPGWAPGTAFALSSPTDRVNIDLAQIYVISASGGQAVDIHWLDC